MSVLGETCTRCGGPMSQATTSVVIESGPLRASHPSLALCPKCTESLEAWIHRRARRSSRRGSGGGHSQRHHETPDPDRDPGRGDELGRDDGRGRILVVALIVAVLAIGAIVFAVVAHF